MKLPQGSGLGSLISRAQVGVVAKLVGLSEGMAADASFARQARRKYLS